MSIEQKRVIDFVGLEPASGKVILTIADHLPWDDELRYGVLKIDRPS